MRLQRLELKGWKSIREMDLTLSTRTVLIGANGAGKSNLLSFFRMLGWMLPPPGQLQLFIGKNGGANTFLFDGAAVTPILEASLTMTTDGGRNDYTFKLAHAAGDTFVFLDERYLFIPTKLAGQANPAKSLGAGQKEAAIIARSEKGEPTPRAIVNMLRKLQLYQFHNTSDTSRIKQNAPVGDRVYLKEDGANLSAFLFYLQNNYPPHYRRIVETLRQLLPFFADFELVPENGYLMLRWREQGTDALFSAHQASDGMLRSMALVSLLQQPEQLLPSVILLDEPELGLHPRGIEVVSGLLRDVSQRAQLIVATQSSALLDHFDPEDVVVVERQDRLSTFHRLSAKDLEAWIDDYSLGEIWEKNIVGGRP